MRWFWIVTVAALFYGCGGKERPDQVTMTNTGGRAGPVTTGGRASGGNGSGGDAGSGAGPDVTPGGAGGDGGVVDALAPIVEITSPPAVLDPDEGEVLLGSNVEVLCSASKSSASGSLPIAPSTVKIAMLDATGNPLKETPGQATGNSDEYSAAFIITDRPSGAIAFRCTASDTGAKRRAGSATIGTFVDKGPTITVTEPLDASSHALSAAVPFEFSVEPSALAAGDEHAAIGEVTLTVDDLLIDDLVAAPGRPGVYIASVDFADRTLFPETPSGDVPVVITATNQRAPTPARSTNSYRFTLDADGPVIKISAPGSGDIVGRTVTVSFSVTDALSKVEDKSILVKVNDEPFPFVATSADWTKKGANYTFTFDSTKIKGSVVQATVDILAKDSAGNDALGASLKLYLDDYSPIVSLDPGPVRLKKIGPPAVCSQSFDPLGTKAASDGQTVPPFATFRVLVWDQTNSLAGADVLHLSGAKRDSVRLYLQPDPSKPILRDSDGDGACDEIIDTDADGLAVPFQQMTALSPTGDMPHDLDDRGTMAPTVLGSECSLTAGATKALCTNQISDMHKVIKHVVPGTPEPVVYAFSPQAGQLCTGDGWDISRYHGWVCVAVAASDVALNRAVSRPLRVCVDDDDDESTNPCEGIEMPSCVEDCTPPSEFPGGVLSYTDP